MKPALVEILRKDQINLPMPFEPFSRTVERAVQRQAAGVAKFLGYRPARALDVVTRGLGGSDTCDGCCIRTILSGRQGGRAAIQRQ